MEKQEVEHVAKLSRIELSPQEVEKYQQQLGGVLSYVDKLQEVETEGVMTADGGTQDIYNVWRDDETQTKMDNDLINMAPVKENGQVKVKKVL